jgi:hypothetical protein
MPRQDQDVLEQRTKTEEERARQTTNRLLEMRDRIE